MYLIAHRGTPFHAPENSLTAISRAISAGADAVEIDVHLTRDRVPVVCHDATTGRTGSVEVVIAESNLSELRSVFLEDGSTIPTLEEVCLLCRGQVWLDVEIKVETSDVGPILRVLSEMGVERMTFITSFHQTALLAVRRLGFIDRTGLIVGSKCWYPWQRAFEFWPIAAVQRAGATDLVIHHRLAHWMLTAALKACGLGLVLWASMEDESKDEAAHRSLYHSMRSRNPRGVVVGRVELARRTLRSSD